MSGGAPLDGGEDLRRALNVHVGQYMQAIDRLRELASGGDTENDVMALTALLREAVFLVASLRRLTEGRTVEELHRAFGAPGDFGYETAIGAALARLYGVA